MAYVPQAHVAPNDPITSAEDNQTIDNEAWLYDNLRTEMKRYHAEIPSAACGADSDEFDSTTLNVAWTAYGGLAVGTIAEFETGAIQKYDLASWPGWLAIQTDSDFINLALQDGGVHKAFTPGTGPWAVIVRVAILNNTDAAKDETIGVLVTDAVPPTNYTQICYGRDSGGTWKVYTRTQAGALDSQTIGSPGLSMYLALVRESAAGSTSPWYSYDGIQWQRLAMIAAVTAVAHLYIGIKQDVSTQRSIYACDFIRTFPTATLRCGRAGNS